MAQVYDPERWRKIESLFHAAYGLTASERDALLVGGCSGDAALRGDVEALLAQSSAANNLLEMVGSAGSKPAAGSIPPVVIGQRLGAYVVEGLIGVGGMGAVYRARDTRLGRNVALKILLASSSDDPERLARFQREAHVLASLNHPHIAAIYGVEEEDGARALVLELVDGETLAERIGRTSGVPVREAVEIAIQIADALDAAHEKRIVHRDLKPANIKITPAGSVKVLDFGLARLAAVDGIEARDSRQSPQTPIDCTLEGAIMGTAAYLSPEQARGRPVDTRSDIWAFGCVVFELLAGRAAFAGETIADIIAGILTREPDWSALPAGTPTSIRRLLRRCLEKELARRLRDIGDARSDLEDAFAEHTVPDGPKSPAWRRAAMAAGLLALGIGASGALIGLTIVPRLRTSPPATFQVTQLTSFADSATAPVLSPDGRMLAFIRGGSAFLSDGQIWAMILPNGEPAQLTHESLPISTPAFSLDGSHIAYTVTDVRRASWDTWVVPVLGGPPHRLFSNATGLTWIDGGRILFSEIKNGMHMGVVVAAENRSNARDVYLPAHERAMAHYSYLSPDRRWVLVVEMDPTWQRCRLVPFDGSSLGRAVGPEGACTSAAWAPDGRWMYFGATVNGEPHLWRQRFPDATPEQITFGPTEEEGIAMAPDGRSLITAIGFRQRAIWMQGPDGDREVPSAGDASLPSFSADGRMIYYLRSSPTTELWVTDRVSGRSAPLVTGFSIAAYDISPDDEEVVFATAAREGASELWVAPLDRSGPPTRVPGSGETPFFGPGGQIVYKASDGRRNYLYTTGKNRSGRQKVSESEISNIFSHSPDGGWAIALTPNVEGGPTAVMLAFPVGAGPPVRVCTGGCLTNWSPDGRFFQIAFHPSSLADRTETFIIPLTPGSMLPALPPSGFQSGEDVAALPGVRRFGSPGTTRVLNAETYAYVKPIVHRNLYRISLP